MLRDPLAELNEQQRKVVLATKGPVLVLAGAGSGKTRALTHRIAYLLHQNLAAPEEVMAVTFTNKAAHEMRERVSAMVSSSHGAPSALGTFHGLGARMLRQWNKLTKRSAAFTILDTGDSERLIRQSLELAGLSHREWSPRTLKHAISKIKNSEQSPAQVAANARSRAEEVTALVYERYQKLLAQQDSYDFDDLILEPVRLLMQNEQVQNHYRQQWRYICVDEYQDTNPVQDHLLKLILNEDKNICVVGDDYQAIYSWRGARVDHILSFERSFPNCQTIYLTQNYRSTPAILTAANQVIAENKVQKHKELWTEQSEGEPINVFSFPSDLEEARTICRLIHDKISQGAKASNYAILYRTNAQSRLFEDQFIRHGTPYTIVGGIRFYERAEIKDAMSLLQLFVNPQATLAFRRLTGVLAYGVGPKTVERIIATANASNAPLVASIITSDTLTPRQQAALRPLIQSLTTAKDKPAANVAALLDTLLNDSGYLSYLKRQPDGEDRLENINELLSVASQYSNPLAFVEAIALMSDIDSLNHSDQNQNGSVLCMTLHAAKGLEFPCVYVVGCEEGLLPHSNSINSAAELEEERRLLYVGMTRAREALTITYATTRTVRGETNIQIPSRFLTALSVDTKQYEDTNYTFATAPSSNEPVYCAYEIGDFVNHPLYGRGVVIETRSSMVTCIFEGHGIKTIDGSTVAV